MGAKISNLKRYCISPIRCGLGGFFIFLLVICITKLLGTIFGSSVNFLFEKEDLLLDMIGFVMFFVIKVLNNINEKKA